MEPLKNVVPSRISRFFMRILGIETSCDETAAAVVENGHRVFSNVIASQIDLHAETGGVVPEVAAREHGLKIIPVIDRALRMAKVSLNDIDAIAVTKEPGLIGCLLTGINTARAFALLTGKPLIPINHIDGHIYSTWLDSDDTIDFHFPIVTLTASGGHNELVVMHSHSSREVIGETLDDAAGEAYDKAARIMGLGYPGGPAISKAVEHGNPNAYPLPRAWMEKHKKPENWRNFHFSFSGLKSAVLRLVEASCADTSVQQYASSGRSKAFSKHSTHLIHVSDLAASFQEAVNEVLSTKLLMAAQKFQAREIHLTGGVSANKDLRQKIQTALQSRKHHLLGHLDLPQNTLFHFPKKLSYCTDNGAMIAAAAYFQRKS